MLEAKYILALIFITVPYVLSVVMFLKTVYPHYSFWQQFMSTLYVAIFVVMLPAWGIYTLACLVFGV